MEELKPKHFQAAMMLATGMASKDVARELKVVQETISQWKKISITSSWRQINTH